MARDIAVAWLLTISALLATAICLLVDLVLSFDCGMGDSLEDGACRK